MEKTFFEAKDIIKKRGETFILSVTRLALEKGKIYGFVGPNGSGKTTLLEILSSLSPSDSGDLFFLGEKIESKKESGLSFRRRTHFVMENPLLFNMNVYKNLEIALTLRGAPKNDRRQNIKNALASVNLEKFEKKDAGKLSRGEVKRAAIARAFLREQEIIFFDEPFANIDEANIKTLEAAIKNVNKKNKTTIIFTAHNIFQAYKLSDEVYTIINGSITRGALENFFSGKREKEKDVDFVKISPNIKIAVVSDSPAVNKIAIDPKDIIISLEKIESSAKNVFKGIIKKTHLENGAVRVYVEIDNSIEFISLITKSSFDKMNLSLGAEVYIIFKAASVTVF